MFETVVFKIYIVMLLILVLYLSQMLIMLWYKDFFLLNYL